MRRAIQVLAGLAISALALWLTLRGKDLGAIAAAALDVFRDEPRIPEALLHLENVVLTPHLGSGTRETRAAMARVVADEIARVASGRAPLHRVA